MTAFVNATTVIANRTQAVYRRCLTLLKDLEPANGLVGQEVITGLNKRIPLVWPVIAATNRQESQSGSRLHPEPTHGTTPTRTASGCYDGGVRA